MRKFLLLAVLGCLTPAPATAREFLGKDWSTWAAELSDSRVAVRRSAAFALGKLAGNVVPTTEKLAAALTDADASVRDAAAFALGEVAAADPDNANAVWGSAGEVLLEKLRDTDARVCRSAAFALGNCGATARGAIPALTQALRDDTKPPLVRRNAAWALGKIGKPVKSAAAVDSLVAALGRDREDALVLRDVAAALGEIGRPTAEPAAKALAEVVRDSRDPVLRKTVMNALVNLIGPELARAPAGQNAIVVRVLQDALKDSDPETKDAAAGALANLGEHAVPALRDLAALLNDATARATTRRNAALALTKMAREILALPENESRAVVTKLASALDAKQPAGVRQFAAETLARLGFPAAEPALKPLLNAIRKDPDETVRHRSVWVFLTADFERLSGAREALLGCLKDANRPLRYDAARALAQGLRADAPKAVIDTLEAMLNDTTIQIYRQTNANVTGGRESGGGKSTVKPDIGGDARYMAAQALAYIGPPANRPSILKTLKALANAKDERTREHSRKALEAINP